MKNILIWMLAGIVLLSACETETGLRAHDPWIRATAQGENGAVYFVLHNHTDQDDELVSVTTTVTDTVEIHQTTLEQGTDIARMELVPSVPVPADSEIIFAPGKYHLMLVGLNKELRTGDHIAVILHFKSHDDIVLDVHVQDTAPDEHSH